VGEYYYGDGMGVNVMLRIAPTSIFEFRWLGCTGVRDRNWGEIVERGGLLELEFRGPDRREEIYGFDSAFVPVKWGQRRYLIVPKEITRFCNAINSGDEPRRAGHGKFLLCRDLDEKPPTGKPELPREFASMLLDAPLRASVVAVKESRLTTRNSAEWRESVVALDIGSKDGAWEGMELFLVDRPIFWGVTITKCDEAHCEAQVLEYGADAPIPDLGWRFSTRDE
jgi:hypothetical protein